MDISCETIITYWHNGKFDICEGLLGNGSPNRYAKRLILQRRDDGHRYILEGVVPTLSQKRSQQAETLARFATAGVTRIVPWHKAKNGSWGLIQDGLYWQCRDYVDATELPRETYALDGWRGREAGQWLRSIQAFQYSGETFLITSYIQYLMTAIQSSSPALFKDLSEVLKALDFTEKDERQLPVVFSHGDFHPGNILWGNQTITSVIDWEFCGLKPICYDAANMLGCIGMDNPDWFNAPMAQAFIKELDLPPMASRYLAKYIVALRFAWMREWWHSHNKAMMIQELDFMWLLLNFSQSIDSQSI